MKQTLCLLAGILCTICTTLVHAENWPQWRGPNYNGASSEKNLPEHFSKTENVAWRAPLPGPNGATPAIWGDSVAPRAAHQSN